MARLAFTAQQKLQDAEGEFAEAIYRFRDAEAANAPEQYALKREMNDAGAKALGIRECIYKRAIDELFRPPIREQNFDYCPMPAWGGSS